MLAELTSVPVEELDQVLKHFYVSVRKHVGDYAYSTCKEVNADHQIWDIENEHAFREAKRCRYHKYITASVICNCCTLLQMVI